MTSGLPPAEQRRWEKVRAVARPAFLRLWSGDADTPTEAVEASNVSLGRGERADAAWLVERMEEKASEKKSKADDRWKRAQMKIFGQLNEMAEDFNSEGSA